MNTKTVFFTGTLLLWSLYCIFVGYRELWGAHTDAWSSTLVFTVKRKEKSYCFVHSSLRDYSVKNQKLKYQHHLQKNQYQKPC